MARLSPSLWIHPSGIHRPGEGGTTPRPRSVRPNDRTRRWGTPREGPMTEDRRFKRRVRRRMRMTGETYTAALSAERRTRPPPRRVIVANAERSLTQEAAMTTMPVAATRLRGIWMGVTDCERSKAFYERWGAYYGSEQPVDGILSATLGGTRLIFEAGHGDPSGAGPFLLFDVTDADALHDELTAQGVTIDGPPKNEPWGRQFNVRDPDGHSIGFLGPRR